MFCYYLRNTYLENKLCVRARSRTAASAWTWARSDDAGFRSVLALDHIVPWRSAYRTLAVCRNTDRTFVLGERLHRPASSIRRRRSAAATGFPILIPDGSWLAQAPRSGQPGCALVAVLARHWRQAQGAGESRQLEYRPIEPAPGRYVKHRIH